MHSDDRQKVARNSIVYMVANVMGRAYIFVTLPLLTANLTGDEFGLYIILVQIAIFIQTLGVTLFGQALFRQHVDYEGNEKKKFVGTLLVSSILFASAISVIVYYGRETLFHIVYPNILRPLDQLMLVTCAWSVIVTLRAFTVTFLKAQERAGRVLVNNVIYGVCLVVTILVFVEYAGRGLQGVMEALLLSELLAQLVMLAYLRPLVSAYFGIRYLHRALVFTWPLLFGSLLMLVFSNLDRVILSHYVSSAEVGIYGFGLMIGNIIALVVTAFVSSYSARMIRIIKENDFKNVSDIITTLMQDDARYVGLMVGGVFVMASFLVAILGRGEGYNNAVLVVCGIALGHFARSIYLFFQNYLFYRHRSIELFGLNALLLIIGGGIIWMMAEMYEIVGVAFVNVISYVIMIPIGWFICSKWSRIQFPVAALRQTVFGLSLLLACEFFIKTMGILMHDPVFWLIKVLEVGVVWVVWRRSLNGLFIMIPKMTRT